MTDPGAGARPGVPHGCDDAAGPGVVAGQPSVEVSGPMTVGEGVGRGPLPACSYKTAGEVAPESDGFKTSGPAAAVTLGDRAERRRDAGAARPSLEELVDERTPELLDALLVTIAALLRVPGGLHLLDGRAAAVIDLALALQDHAETAEFGGAGDGAGTLTDEEEVTHG